MKRLEFLRLAVAEMRALGVTRWDGIELGADPTTHPSEVTDEQRAERERAAARRRYEIQFAASSIRPPFPGVQGHQNGLKSDVPRSNAPGRRHGLSG